MQPQSHPADTAAAGHPDTIKADFRNGMARLGAAVNIVTTDGPGGKAGFAATAVCSVTDSPPTLLVCLNRASSAFAAVRDNGVVCVNVVGDAHQPLCNLFGGKTPMDQRFSAASWSALETGAPALNGALVSFDCRIESSYDGGTHAVLICKVVAIVEGGEGRPLIYFERAYHSF
jgi:flavin reductase